MPTARPFWLTMPSVTELLSVNGEPMAMAGVWESWKTPDGGVLRTTCIVTTGPNTVMAPIHDRMPVIIGPAQWSAWLAGPSENIESLLAPYAADEMQAWPVSPRVSKTANDEPGLAEPAKSDTSE